MASPFVSSPNSYFEILPSKVREGEGSGVDHSGQAHVHEISDFLRNLTKVLHMRTYQEDVYL